MLSFRGVGVGWDGPAPGTLFCSPNALFRGGGGGHEWLPAIGVSGRHLKDSPDKACTLRAHNPFPFFLYLHFHSLHGFEPTVIASARWFCPGGALRPDLMYIERVAVFSELRLAMNAPVPAVRPRLCNAGRRETPASERRGPHRQQGLCSHPAHLWATSDFVPCSGASGTTPPPLASKRPAQ